LPSFLLVVQKKAEMILFYVMVRANWFLSKTFWTDVMEEAVQLIIDN